MFITTQPPFAARRADPLRVRSRARRRSLPRHRARGLAACQVGRARPSRHGRALRTPGGGRARSAAAHCSSVSRKSAAAAACRGRAARTHRSRARIEEAVTQPVPIFAAGAGSSLERAAGAELERGRRQATAAPRVFRSCARQRCAASPSRTRSRRASSNPPRQRGTRGCRAPAGLADRPRTPRRRRNVPPRAIAAAGGPDSRPPGGVVVRSSPHATATARAKTCASDSIARAAACRPPPMRPMFRRVAGRAHPIARRAATRTAHADRAAAARTHREPPPREPTSDRPPRAGGDDDLRARADGRPRTTAPTSRGRRSRKSQPRCATWRRSHARDPLRDVR